MESPSKGYGDHHGNITEECQSSESGWTMYIGGGSSMDDDYGGGGVVYDGSSRKNKGVVVKDEDDEDTDDSMASDASSGPSHLHLQQPWEQVAQQDDHGKQHKSSGKKSKKATGKKKDQESRKKDEYHQAGLVNEKRGVITTVQSGNRAWFLGKRK
uniref:protein SOB FIVE-LIKE 4-like n=1 Tax=Erigeron canadensis TaxID=72917 RepID=UPI001CB88F9C|nr:protein SOB FIVE-LIKE 4-like [Erigeron canadensis]